MLSFGMMLQAFALLAMYFISTMTGFIVSAIIIGVGTAIVYPTFLSAISDFSHPSQRAQTIGIFRFWRDSGYAFGAICTIIISAFFDVEVSLIVIGLMTLASSLIIKFRMD